VKVIAHVRWIRLCGQHSAHLIPGRLPINRETPHDTSSTDKNKCHITDQTTTDSTTEERREKGCNLISTEGPREPREVSKILGARRQVRHKIRRRVVIDVTTSRDANLGCAEPHPPRVIHAVGLDISLRGAKHVLTIDKVVLLLELVPMQENVALIK